MTPCEDCESVRNFSLEPRCQGALCAGCAEKLEARVRDIEEAVCEFLDKLDKHGAASSERVRFLVGRK